MIKLSGALMVLANIAITVALLAAIAAHAHSPSVKDKDSADDIRQSDGTESVRAFNSSD